MSKTATLPPAARSWRDIPQEIAPRAMSSEGRKRLTFGTLKLGAIVISIVATAWGAFEVWNTWQHEPTKLAAPVKSQPVKTITLRTDGVLDRAWAERTLALPRNVSLMELDLYSLRTRLLASGQARSAVLTRKFPDTLAVTLEERSPVVRVKAQIGDDAPREFLVARDGTVFVGAGFSPDLINSLPWLAGVKLVRAEAGFEPIAGLDKVADLLGATAANAPALYRDWRIISLQRFATDEEIVVQAGRVSEIVFGLREPFFSQIARLDLILDHTQAQTEKPLRKVNLAVGGAQVPVALDDPAPSGKTAAASDVWTAPRRPPESPAFFPQTQRSSTRREL